MSRAESLDGIYPGVVTSNADPLNCGRVKVVFPWMDNGVESDWCRLVQPYAGQTRGLFFVPEVGDEVICVFEHGDMNHPMVIGATWNGVDKPPEPNDPSGENHHKVIETRSGHRLVFDDTPGQESIQLNDCSLNNIVRFDSLTNTLTLNARTGDIIVRASRTLNLNSRELFFDVTDSASLTVGGDHTVTVKQYATELCDKSKTWNAQSSLTIDCTKIDLKASDSFSLDGEQAQVSVNGQDSDQTVVAGTTTEATNHLTVTADEVYERAERRVWRVDEMHIETQALALEASGNVKLEADTHQTTASGELSYRGKDITTEGGTVKVGGNLDMKPAKKPPSRSGEGQDGLGPKPDWVEFQITDASGMPLPYIKCEVTLPDGSKVEETTDEKGMLRFGHQESGQAQISIEDRYPG